MRYGSTCRPQPESRRELSLADYALGADLAEVDVLVVCARGEDGLGGVEGDLWRVAGDERCDVYVCVHVCVCAYVCVHVCVCAYAYAYMRFR